MRQPREPRRATVMSYFYLVIAIIAEVLATSFLPATEGFKKFIPSVLTILGYSIAFYALAQCVKVIPIGVAYAIWCGLGILLICATGYFVYGQKLDLRSLIGIGFIIAGIMIVYLSSETIPNS